MHTHTEFSFDGRCTVDELCASAAEKGVSVLAITEHFDIDSRGGGDYYLRHEAQRLESMERAAKKYDGRLTLLYGVEMGQPHIRPEITREFLSERDFDVVLGSVHDVRPEIDVYSTRYPDLRACDNMFEQYFSELCEVARCGFVDVVTHYDYPMRVMEHVFRERGCSLRRYREHMLPMLKAVADSGVALEINTSGMRRWQRTHAGEEWILEDYKRAGGERVTVGSDTHKADGVGVGFHEVCAMLRGCGFDRLTVYRGRKPEYIII